MDTKLAFDQYAEAFAPYSQLDSASFVHGMLIGQVSSTPSMTEAQWIKRLVDEGGMGAIKESFLVLLHQFYTDTLAGLNSADCDLNLVLPTDDEPLAMRVKHLAQWCEGYLYGMGLGALGEVSKEVTEVLADFGEISLIEIPEQEDEQANESLIELIEFVRMGAIMVYEELNPVPAQPIDVPADIEQAFSLSDQSPTKPTLH